ncbi:MAG: STAS domain-containing protein [Planctomycetia bacterium]|nr:STAS domain-containing protein [Planctomycetia bacterium]
MEISQTRSGEVLVVELKGRLDASTTPAVEQAVIGAIDAGAKWLLLDLTGMDYVSSIGLRVFVLAVKRLKTAGGSARFCGVQEPVQRIFDMAGLSMRLEIFPTQESALLGFPQ